MAYNAYYSGNKKIIYISSGFGKGIFSGLDPISSNVIFSVPAFFLNNLLFQVLILLQ